MGFGDQRFIRVVALCFRQPDDQSPQRSGCDGRVLVDSGEVDGAVADDFVELGCRRKAAVGFLGARPRRVVPATTPDELALPQRGDVLGDSEQAVRA